MEQIYLEFKTLVGETDLSDRTLNTVLDNIYSAEMSDDEKVTAFTKAKSIVESMQGNVNAIIASKVKAATEKKESENSKPKVASKEPKGVDEDLKAQVQSLLEEFQAQKREKTIAQKRAEVIAAAKELGVKDNDFCVEAASLIPLDENSKPSEIAEKIMNLYNKKKTSGVEEVETPDLAKGDPAKYDQWAEKFSRNAPSDN